MAGIVDKIDTALEEYYIKMGRKDYRNDGNGLFKQYADDNGFEDADIDVELQADPTDCLLVEFDDNFPLHQEFQDDDKLKAIHSILKYIVQHGKAPFPSEKKKQKATTKLQIDLNISEEKAQEIADKIYKTQLECLESSGFPEPDLMYFFAVGYLNKMPLLTWLVDSFTLDKTKHYVQNVENSQRSALDLEHWARTNQFMKDLEQRNKAKAIKLRTAMNAYSNRLLSRLQYVSPTKIDDDIQQIVDYVCAIPQFITVLMQTTKGSKMGPPFCVDVSFAVRGTKSEIANISPVNSQEDDDDDDGDDDDDDDDDDLYGDHKGNQQQSNIDRIGDFKKKLEVNTRCYASQIVPDVVLDLPDDGDVEEKEKENDPVPKFVRFLKKGYNAYRDALRKANQFDEETYPRNKRFGIFVDRRKSAKKDKQNEVTFFQQLESCDTIPADHVAEWYIQAVRDCVIPGFDKTKQAQQQKITAQDNVNGQLITFSFNVDAEDDIKCYVLWNGQAMRFKGDNLGKILSYLFVEIQDQNVLKAVNEQLLKFDKQVVDMKFEQFYQQIQCGYDPVHLKDLRKNATKQ